MDMALVPTTIRLAVGMFGALFAASALAAPPDDVVRQAALASERVWQRCESRDRGALTAPELFTAALAWTAAKAHPDRLVRILDLATALQDRDPRSKTFGNFRWYRAHPAVDDPNAVEFSMLAGTLLWNRHRDTMPAEARARLESLVRLAVDGCRGHMVRASYTNIAFMNATNLILLGESLGLAEHAQEGYRRLDAAARFIVHNGTHEYDSPTYYGMNVTALGLLESFCRRDRERTIAHGLLELLWTDIAANWLPFAHRLGGAHSRTYDYLHGHGELDTALKVHGWLPDHARGDTAIYQAFVRPHPPESVRPMKLPRLVRQSWGEEPEQFRTHYVLPGVSLSTAGTGYHDRMDMPLTVDFAGDRDSVRGYFVSDGRNDPFGKVKISAGAHDKARHLDPCFAAAQRTTDALALVIYRKSDLPPDGTPLATHFVLPAKADAVYVGERRIERAETVAVRPGEALIMRRGLAAVGIRVLWTRDPDPIRYVDDGNPHGAVRLTISHTPEVDAGAALWVRIGGALETDAAFDRWRKAFATEPARVSADASGVRLRILAPDGPIGIAAQKPFRGRATLEPAPARLVLDVDGVDLGRQILAPVARLTRGEP